MLSAHSRLHILCLILSYVCLSFSVACDSTEQPHTPALDMEPPPEIEHMWEVEASFPETLGTVMSVWGSPNASEWGTPAVWAVGGLPDRGRMWTRGDEGWSEINLPNEGPLLNWVHGAGGHLWVVGNDGQALRRVTPEAGGDGSWERFDADTEQDLWGVWARSPQEVWAVGGDPIGDGEVDPVITRFDGAAWARVPVPDLDRAGVRSLFKVYGDAERVFAVGMKGVILGDLGAGWQQLNVVSAGDAPPSSEDFVSLWGQGDDLLAVGGRSNGMLARWDGSEWRSTMLMGVPGLNGVWVDERGRATTVGVRGAALTIPPESLSGDRERTGTPLVLHAVWGRAGEVWAVGGSLDSSPPWEGVILRSPH